MRRSSSTMKNPAPRELRLIELVKQNPVLYDTEHPFTGDTPHKNMLWKSIAEELNTPANVLKKQWNKLSSGYMKKRRDIVEGKNVKTDLVYDQALSFLAKKSGILKRAKSCGEIPAVVEREDHDSIGGSSSHLSVVSEDSKCSKTRAETHHEIGGAVPLGSTPQNAPEIFPATSTSRVLRPRRSEPLRIVSANNTKRVGTPKQASPIVAVPVPVPASARRKRTKGSYCGHSQDDATLAFFESMALTVAMFPQHLQASIKMRICNVVTETEFELCSPKMR
ncbi:uncharacterized protein LOC125500162 isoform X2 [Athalia rosae]|nr:uncharacterized protein LOC125500162 isoform X2 [Athalia rosae]